MSSPEVKKCEASDLRQILFSEFMSVCEACTCLLSSTPVRKLWTELVQHKQTYEDCITRLFIFCFSFVFILDMSYFSELLESNSFIKTDELKWWRALFDIYLYTAVQLSHWCEVICVCVCVCVWKTIMSYRYFTGVLFLQTKWLRTMQLFQK